MLHAVIIKPDKFKTACGIGSPGRLLTDKKFRDLTGEELDSIDCDLCRAKVAALRSHRSHVGRCILVDLPSPALQNDLGETVQSGHEGLPV